MASPLAGSLNGKGGLGRKNDDRMRSKGTDAPSASGMAVAALWEDGATDADS